MNKSKAILFDVKRFAVHDGNGIRTTLFFKGCPLRCIWCQNPEGLRLKIEPLWVEKQCIHCHLCEKTDPYVHFTNRPILEKGADLEQLVRICPANALRLAAKEYDVDSLVSIAMQDEVFFKHGGGVTFSGGEPLMQADSLIELARCLKVQGVSCAIESSFYASLDVVKNVVKYLDQIYVDLKIFDRKSHQKYTGVSNEQILENIEYILTSEHKEKVIVRTPLIPGCTATSENISSIASFISSLDPEVRYELLNYNPLASSKYALLNQPYALQEAKPFTKEELLGFQNIAMQYGIKNLII